MGFEIPFICTLLGPAAVVLGACSAPEQEARVAPISCHLSAEVASGGTHVSAIVQSERALSGEYHLQLGQGADGQVRISQGGPFATTAGVGLTLGQLTLPPGSVSGHLTITANDTTIFCPTRGLITDN